MKSLRNHKAVEELQELIDKCANKENTPAKHRIVRKIGKNKMRTRCKLRLTCRYENTKWTRSS